MKDQIDQIKKVFELNDDVEIEFKIDNNDDAVNVNKPLKSFDDNQVFNLILIDKHSNKENVYLIQTNLNDDIKSFELKPGATVRDLQMLMIIKLVIWQT